jgi:hypothetical protein
LFLFCIIGGLFAGRPFQFAQESRPTGSSLWTVLLRTSQGDGPDGSHSPPPALMMMLQPAVGKEKSGITRVSFDKLNLDKSDNQ